jgi:hypothetical protein
MEGNSEKDEVGKDDEEHDSEDERAAAEMEEMIQLHQQQHMVTLDAGEADTVTAVVGAEVEEQEMEFHTLLEQLRVEPTDNEEVMAKFSIFETYMSTVSTLREQVYEMWSRTKIEILEAAPGESGRQTVAQIHSSLKKVDSEANMGCDDSRVWLIYSMMKQAAANHKVLSIVLKDINTKLSLINKMDCDCPMCLEPLTAADTKILSCCHKTCNECWNHWVEVNQEINARACCPVCMNEEFVQQVYSMATPRADTAVTPRNHEPRVRRQPPAIGRNPPPREEF